MVSTPTTRLRLEKQAQGDNLLTWGTVTNAIFDRIDEAIAGEAAISTTGGNTTLTSTNYLTDQARMARLYVTGALTSGATLIVPAVDKQYTVVNATTGAHTLTIKTASVAGVTVPQGTTQVVYIRASGAAGYVGPPPTSGTSLLKGNGSGGFANAVADTDYLTPSNNLAALTDKPAAFTAIKQAATEAATGVVELATTGEAEAGTDTTRAVTPAGLLAAVTGKQTIWVPAVAMVTRTTAGAGSGTVETTTNKVMIKTLDFDTSTQEYAQFAIRMPKSWNEGTVTFAPSWSHPATTTNFGVVWTLAGVACSNDDALDAAFETAVSSIDTGGTTNDLYIGPVSAAITIAGTPAVEDYVVFQVSRLVSSGSDTMAVDARLHGITLYITTDAMTDD